MLFSSTVPILYSADVRRSIAYYVDVLGFESRWEWDDPPTFGGVSRNSVEIFFCKEGQGNPGSWIAIMLKNVDEYYESVKSRGAKILAVPKTMEWGMREMLVEDPDGHIIRFGHGASLQEEREQGKGLPATVRILSRASTTDDVPARRFTFDWSVTADEALQKIPVAQTIAFIAEDTASGKVVGHVYLSVDSTGIYYVKNLAVHPDWRGQHIGTALMEELSNWLEQHAVHGAYIGLHTPEQLIPFYKHVGFAPANGMYREIKPAPTSR